MALNLAGSASGGPGHAPAQLGANLHIVVITADAETARALETLSGGGSDYQLSRVAPNQLIAAVQEARAAGALTSQQLARKLVTLFKPDAGSVSNGEFFTFREQQVAELLARGRTYKCIATDLGVSLDTVRTYLRRIYRKFGVHSRTDAVVRFLSLTNRAAA